eukprot:146264-Lingulodinium_polyedra.AAC.1
MGGAVSPGDPAAPASPPPVSPAAGSAGPAAWLSPSSSGTGTCTQCPAGAVPGANSTPTWPACSAPGSRPG